MRCYKRERYVKRTYTLKCNYAFYHPFSSYQYRKEDEIEIKDVFKPVLKSSSCIYQKISNALAVQCSPSLSLLLPRIKWNGHSH